MSPPYALFNGESASPSKQDITTFLNAARSGDLKIISQMLDTYGHTLINAKDKDGNIALIEAAWKGHADVVSALLDNGARIDARDRNGDTALTVAAWNGRTMVVSILLNKGAKIDVENDNGYTALILATADGHIEVENLLLHHVAVQRAQKLTAEVDILHSGIDQEVKSGSRLVLRVPQKPI